MNTKLDRVLNEIAKTEEKIAVWQEHLEELNIRRKQLEDAEIIKTVRSMRLGSREMLAFLESIQNGTLPVPLAQTGVGAGQAENIPEKAGDYEKPGTEQGETGNNNAPEEPAEREDKEDEEKD